MTLAAVKTNHWHFDIPQLFTAPKKDTAYTEEELSVSQLLAEQKYAFSDCLFESLIH